MSTQFNFAPYAEKIKITSYRDLLVWTRAMDIVVVCYNLSKQIP